MLDRIAALENFLLGQKTAAEVLAEAPANLDSSSDKQRAANAKKSDDTATVSGERKTCECQSLSLLPSCRNIFTIIFSHPHGVAHSHFDIHSTWHISCFAMLFRSPQIAIPSQTALRQSPVHSRSQTCIRIRVHFFRLPYTRVRTDRAETTKTSRALCRSRRGHSNWTTSWTRWKCTT